MTILFDFCIQVYNNGGGTVQASEITIYWPYELQSSYAHGKHLLYLMHPPEVKVYIMSRQSFNTYALTRKQ